FTRSLTITGFADGDALMPSHKPSSVLCVIAADGLPVPTLAGVTGIVSVTDWLQVTGLFDVQSDRIMRKDNLPWASLGFAAGQYVSFTGMVGTRKILGFDNTSGISPTPSGLGSALVLDVSALGSALTPATNVTGTVAVTNRYHTAAGALFDVPDNSSILRKDGKPWA